jgi:dTDP-glucose pyrophosphorylase
MQAVFVCGGRGMRLMPRPAATKSLIPVAGTTLLRRLVEAIGTFHSSKRPPVAIVDAHDAETPSALDPLIPDVQLVRQPTPDGVANALLLAEPYLDDLVLVVLGDLFLDGAFSSMPPRPTLVFWSEATAAETKKNFGIAATRDGTVRTVVEKPRTCDGLRCGMGVYVLTRDAIDAFRRAPVDARSGERGVTDGIRAAVEAGIDFHTVSFSGHYVNVNSHADLQAVERYVRTSPRR